MHLSPQDKLALALTSAGSMRNLAKLVGVTHQKIGRWVRGEAKQGIPAAALPSINLAFHFHKEVSRAQAKVDRIPFNEAIPIFVNRPTLRNGQPGERVYIENTQYISRDVRDAYFSALQRTKQISNISIRSTINLYSYTKTPPKRGAKGISNAMRIRTDKDQANRQTLKASFERREAELPGKGYIAPIYTPMSSFDPRSDIRLSLSDIETKLRQKHEPHAIALADQYLIQTVPGQYEIKPKRTSAKAKRTALKRR